MRFIFVFDERDFIFHQDFVSEGDRKEFIMFLSNLLKDKPYLQFAYMTGILPIAKYSSGSELNMFVVFTMAKSPAFSDYFGFTEAEVTKLYERYLVSCEHPAITQEELKGWYNSHITVKRNFIKG
ncbi:MAG: AAA family ATPase [Eubacterium sp.]|nr:AAA family ATPase [Eubacterium sp.]